MVEEQNNQSDISEIENLRELVLEHGDDIRNLKIKCDELEAKNKEHDEYIHWRSKL